MKKFLSSKALLAVAGLPLMAGCVVYDHPGRGGYRVVEPAPVVVVEEPSTPPPVRVEVVPPRPNMGFVWVAGRWDWNGHWVWVPGRWTPPPKRGAVWEPGHWEKHGHGHAWVAGHWR